MDKWQSHVDKQLKDVLGDGNTSHLPNAGKPLELEDDSHVPAEHRLANKVMIDNDVLPPWMMLGKDIDKRRHQIRADLQKMVRVYLGQLGDAKRANDFEAQTRIEARWQSVRAEILDRIDDHNRAVLDYNLMVPRVISQKLPILTQQEFDLAFEKATRRQVSGVSEKENS